MSGESPNAIEQPNTAEAAKPGLGLLTVVAAVSFVLGYVVFRILQWIVSALWTDIPANSFDNNVPWYYLLGLPVAAGVVVALLRRRADGHNALTGLSAKPVSASDYPAIILAITASLAGGIVLGPEVALMSTGSMIGFVFAKKASKDPKRAALVGAFGSLAALVVEPMRTGSMNLDARYEFSVHDLWTAVIAGALTAVAVGIARWLAVMFTAGRGGDKPVIWQLALGGLAVGLIAMAYQNLGNEPVHLVMTSGEAQIKPLVQLGTASLIITAVSAKLLAYAFSMGLGFRGGPYFPAMFAGAGIGAVLGIQLTDGSGTAPALAGVIAAVIFLAKPKWLFVIAFSVIIGLIMGGVAMLPMILIGAIMGKIVPRLAQTDHLKPEALEAARTAEGSGSS